MTITWLFLILNTDAAAVQTKEQTISAGQWRFRVIKLKTQYSIREISLIVLFYLLLLQNVIQEQVSLVGYLDESVALLGIAVLIFRFITKENVVLKKTELFLFCGLLVFLAAGLCGNLIFKYQQLEPTVKDIFACLKFFLALIAGEAFIRSEEIEERTNVLVSHSKFAILVLFVMLLLDILFGTFATNEKRYGLPVVSLMYNHPTSLAATAVFLLSILSLFYKKENNFFIFLTLIILFFTLRSKAIAAVAVYLILFLRVLCLRKKIGLVYLLLTIVIVVCLAWDQISYYYFQIVDESARAALTQTSFEIFKDYFPLGTGFGTFASNVAAEFYSPVYFKYGLNAIYGLQENEYMFASDTFWPIIIGQTGFIGTCGYGVALGAIILCVLRSRRYSNVAYMAGLFILSYLFISSTSESAFCHPMAVPMALLLGGILGLERKHRYTLVRQ